MTTHAVLGLGEVGAALTQVLPDPATYDGLDGPPPADVDPVDVLHVAIPWDAGFTTAVEAHQRRWAADMVIVHSTVPVGTCDPHGWVHSPVRGRHPDLVDGLKTFTKHVGGWRAYDAANVLVADAGMTCRIHDRAAVTEAGKLWELAQFGMQVAVEHAIADWCRARGLPHDEVYAAFARTYNDGYRELGESRFVRPVLEHQPGPVGGHCVTAGAALLGHSLVEFVLGTVTADDPAPPARAFLGEPTCSNPACVCQ